MTLGGLPLRRRRGGVREGEGRINTQMLVCRNGNASVEAWSAVRRIWVCKCASISQVADARDRWRWQEV